MALQSGNLAAREGNLIDFRSEPLRVRIELNDLVSSDRYDLLCAFEFSARVGDHPADRKLFAELLLSDQSAVTKQQVAAHLRPALVATAAVTVNQPVAALLSESGRSALQDTLRKAADAAAFNSGLLILPPFALELTCPMLQQQQRELAQRSRVEAAAAGRLDHLRHATELLKEFESIRLAAPSISAGQVLERIAPADRGALLEATLASNAEQSTGAILYAVAGTQLVRLNLDSDPVQLVAIELPTTLGPVRSVQRAMVGGRPHLLVGARSGVLLINPDDPRNAIAYADPKLNSSLGFNRAVYLEDSRSIAGTHGEAGFVRWSQDQPGEPASRLSSAELTEQCRGPVRNLHAIDGTAAVCSVANCVVLIDGNERRVLAAESTSPVVKIVPSTDRLFIIHEDGSVVTLDRLTRKILRCDRHGGDVCAAGRLPWLDGQRLLLSCASGPVDCVGTDDSLITRFNSVYRGFRDIVGSNAWVAAVSPDRQRLIAWHSWDGRAPVHDVHLMSVTRHRIADIAFS